MMRGSPASTVMVPIVAAERLRSGRPKFTRLKTLNTSQRSCAEVRLRG